MRIKVNIDLKVGRIVKYFVLCDLALLAGWGLLEPVFSIFIVQKVAGATLTTVGIAAAIYWLLRSVLQLPVANYLDRMPGERDDFQVLIAGLLIAAFSAFSFILVDRIWALYFVQALHAIGFALVVPAWSTIFSRHLDKDRMAFDWSLDSTAAGISAGVSGFFGGIIAAYAGFTPVFILIAIFSIAAALIIFATPSLVLPAPIAAEPVMKDHVPMKVPH